MTVKELKEQLEKMPEDADVRTKHQVCSDEAWLENIELGRDGYVWLLEL